MARLPRYQRSGVQIRQPQGIDYAGFREEAGAAQAMSQAFDKMSQFLYKGAEEYSVQTGLERVREEGAQPVLEALKVQGGPRGLAEKTAYEAANRVAIAEIRTEAELEITKILDDGQKKGQSFSTIQARLKDIKDGFPASLSLIDPVSAGLLRNQLGETTSKAELRYSKWWTGKIAAAQKKKQNDVAANEAEFIVGNATVPGYTTQAIDDDIAKGSQTLRDLGVKPELVDKWAEDVKEKAYKENTLFSFYQMPIAEQKAKMENILGGQETLPGMDYETSIRFVNGLLRPEYNRNLSVMKSQSDFVVNKVTDYENILESGGQVSEDVIADLRNKSNDVAEYDGGQALAAANQLQESETFFSQLRGASLSEVEAMVVDLQDGADGTLDTAIEVKRFEQASTFLKNMKTAIAQDPMGYAERVGFIEPREQLVAIAEDGSLQVNEAALENRSMQAQRVAGYYQLSAPKLLFANEARELGVLLDKAEGNAKLQVLGAMSKFDAQLGEVLTDLADYNPNMALVGALVSEGATEAAQLAVAGMDRIKAGEKPFEFTDNNVVPVYQETFGRAITTPKHSQAIKGVAKAIYTELAANRGVEAFDSEIYKEALQLAAGYRVVNGEEYGGIQEVRGVPTFINPKEQAGSYERILNEITPETIQIATGQVLDPALAAQINENENYKIRNIGGDKYVIEYGEKGDAVVQDTSGAPIIFNSKQLINAMVPTPPEAMMISTQPSAPAPADQPAQGGFRGAQAVTAPEVSQQAPAFPEVKGISRADMAKLRTSMEDISMPPGVERLMPFVDTVPDGTSNEDYFAYMEAVLGGYRNSYDNWKASQ